MPRESRTPPAHLPLLTDRVRDAHIRRVKDAKKYLEKFKRVDIAIDSFYNDPGMFSNTATPTAATSRRPEAPSTSKLNTLFDKYKGAGIP